MAKKTLYTAKAINNLIDTLVDLDYEIITIPGVLLDSYICISPKPELFRHGEFREVAINEWQSAYKVRTSSKLSKRLLKDIEAAKKEDM